MKMLRAFYMALKIMSLARFANIVKIYQCMKLPTKNYFHSLCVLILL